MKPGRSTNGSICCWNIAVGGNWGGAKGFDDSRHPQTMQVDYVRVYQNDESCTAASAPSSGELVWNGNFDCGSAKKWNGLGAYNGATAQWPPLKTANIMRM